MFLTFSDLKDFSPSSNCTSSSHVVSTANRTADERTSPSWDEDGALEEALLVGTFVGAILVGASWGTGGNWGAGGGGSWGGVGSWTVEVTRGGDSLAEVNGAV